MEDKAPTWLRDEDRDLGSYDRFDVTEIVDSIAGLLRETPTPFTVSLSGAWGVGKTTIAKAIERSLTKAPVIPVCYVDVWTHDIGSLRKTLVVRAGAALSGKTPETIAEEIDGRILRTISKTRDKAEFNGRILKRETWQNQWRLLLGSLAGLAVLLVVTLATSFLTDGTGFWGWVNTSAAGLVGALLAFLVLRSGLFLSVYTENESNGPSVSVDVALRDEFASLVGPNASSAAEKVVVIVDNLDRLRADDALLALAEIRALVDIDGSRCAFVIPIDRAAFVEQLADKLGDRVTARDYLDKFFNLDVQLLAPAPMQIHRFAADMARKLLGPVKPDDEDSRGLLIRTLVAGSNDSPRYVTRVLNGVATRRWMLRAEEAAHELALIAVVEVLATTAPDIAWLMSRNPVAFVNARNKIVETNRIDTQAAEAARLIQLAAAERRRTALDDSPAAGVPEESARERAATSRTVASVLRFLASTHFLDMNAETIELIARLRPDPIWAGVVNAAEIRLSLLDGDKEALERALPADRPDRLAAIQAAVEEIEELLALQQSPSGLTAFAALHDAAGQDTPVLQAFELAARLTADLPIANLKAPDPALLKVIEAAGSNSPIGQRRMIWVRLSTAIRAEAESDEQGPSYGGLVRLAVAAQRIGSETDLNAAQVAFDAASEDDAEALFEPEASLRLISEERLHRYLQALVAWAEPGEDVGPIIDPGLAIRRLTRARDSQWSADDHMADMAADVATGIERSGSLPDPADTLVELVQFLEPQPPTTQYTRLALAVISRAETHPAVAALALNLPIPADDEQEVRNLLTGHLRTSYDAAAWGELIDGAEAKLIQLAVPLSEIATERWIGGRDREFLSMALRFERKSDELHAAIDSLTADSRWDRTSELAEALVERGGIDRIGRLATQLGEAIESNPLPVLQAGMTQFLRALSTADPKKSAAVRMTLALALKARSKSATPTDLGLLASIGRALSDAPSETEVASGIVGAANDASLSSAEPDMLDWILRRLYRRAQARSFYVRVLGAVGDPRTLVALGLERAGSLDHHLDVRQQFLARAAGFAPEALSNSARSDQVNQLLAAAAQWSDRPLAPAEASYLGTLRSYLGDDERFIAALEHLSDLGVTES